jgi:Glycerol-3-phosphate dehydrogenase
MKIGVFGTGAYGISLAMILKENNHSVKMWTKYKEEAKYLSQKRVSPNLKNIIIDEDIEIDTNFKKTVKGMDLILIAVPAGVVDDVSKKLKKHLKKKQHICIASKGIEQDTCLFVYDVLKQHIDTDQIGVISGPTFAIDVAAKVPVGLSLGTTNEDTAKIIKEALQNDHVKLRTTTDILGIEICGSIKNVIAIANGMLDGMGLPISTQAMMITESLNDIKELIDTLGGKKTTILSFAGFGDLLLTCTSVKSRNFTFGQLLGKKVTEEELKRYMETTTIEGLYTLKSIHQLLRNKEVNMPIIDLIYDIIYNDKAPEDLITFLIEKG